MTGELMSLAACNTALIVEVEVQLKAAEEMVRACLKDIVKLTWEGVAVLLAVFHQLHQILPRHHTGRHQALETHPGDSSLKRFHCLNLAKSSRWSKTSGLK